MAAVTFYEDCAGCTGQDYRDQKRFSQELDGFGGTPSKRGQDPSRGIRVRATGFAAIRREAQTKPFRYSPPGAYVREGYRLSMRPFLVYVLLRKTQNPDMFHAIQKVG